MKCTYCKSEIGTVAECYVCFCALSKSGFGIQLADQRGEIVAWVSEERMYCKACRPNYVFTNVNWSFKINEEPVKNPSR